MTQLQFAQISDIHISAEGDHHDLLSGRSADFLARVVTELNQLAGLDFVLFSGDLVDTGLRAEVAQFQQIVATLKTPYFVISGNHDRRSSGQSEGLSRRQFARRFNPQIEARPREAEAQVGYWSQPLTETVQLIGLDSIRDEDWGGEIDRWQQAWLTEALARHRDKLVIVAIHHPLHVLAPIDARPEWRNFVCDNGRQLLARLDESPQVKLVLTGHHHLTKVDQLGQRLHVATPALALYPCAYRLLQLRQTGEGGWRLSWETRPATNPATIAEARQRMQEVWQEIGFAPDFIQHHLKLARGDAYDRQGSTWLR